MGIVCLGWLLAGFSPTVRFRRKFLQRFVHDEENLSDAECYDAELDRRRHGETSVESGSHKWWYFWMDGFGYVYIRTL